jgi:hypothetical protein
MRRPLEATRRRHAVTSGSAHGIMLYQDMQVTVNRKLTSARAVSGTEERINIDFENGARLTLERDEVVELLEALPRDWEDVP